MISIIRTICVGALALLVSADALGSPFQQTDAFRRQKRLGDPQMKMAHRVDWVFATADYHPFDCQYDNIRNMYLGGNEPDEVPDLFAINRRGTDSTEVHILSGAHEFQRWVYQTTLPLPPTDESWDFVVGYLHTGGSRGGCVDLAAVHKRGTPSGMTEIHVFSGEERFEDQNFHVATALHETGDSWAFLMRDWNRQGKADLVGINRWGTESGSTEVHILRAESDFQAWVLQTATPLHETRGHWSFAMADVDRKGVPDLVAIKQSGTDSSTTELHILRGEKDFQAWLLQTPTILHETDAQWAFTMADYNQDEHFDLIAIKRDAVASTEVHILNGNADFQAFLFQTPTLLHPTPTTLVPAVLLPHQ